MKQLGAIQVYSLDEMLDMAVLFNYLPPLKGRAVGIIGIGGGNSVLAADSSAREGLSVPQLPSVTRRQLEAIYSSEAGGSFRNPVDMYFAKFNLVHEALRAVVDSPEIDVIIIHVTIGWSPKNDVDLTRTHIELLTGICHEVKKPVVVVLRPFGPAKYTRATGDVEAALLKPVSRSSSPQAVPPELSTATWNIISATDFIINLRGECLDISDSGNVG